MPRRRGRRGHDRRKRGEETITRRLHDESVQEILDDPSILKIQGLNKETVIHTYLMPEYGKPRIHTVDVTFFTRHDDIYEFFPIDVKRGYGKALKQGDIQLYIAWKYFKNNWVNEMNNIRGKIDKQGEVWVDPYYALEQVGEYLCGKPTRYKCPRIKLGTYFID